MTAISSDGACLSAQGKTVQLQSPDGTSMIIENGKISVSGKQLVLNTEAMAIGTDALYKALMLTPQFQIWATTHTHTNGNFGSPTGPPIMPFPEDAGSTRVKLT